MLSIISATSQTDSQPASNLLLPEEHRAWAFRGERASVELLLSPPSPIFSVSVVNSGSQQVAILASEHAQGDDERLWHKMAGCILRTDKEVNDGSARTRKREFVGVAGSSAAATKTQPLPPVAQSLLWKRIKLVCTCAGLPADGSLAGLACIRVETEPRKEPPKEQSAARADHAHTGSAPAAAPSHPHSSPHASKRASLESSPCSRSDPQHSPATEHKHPRPQAPAALPHVTAQPEQKRQKLHNKAVFHGGDGGVVRLHHSQNQQAGKPKADKAQPGAGSAGGAAQTKAHSITASSDAGMGGGSQDKAHAGASGDGAAMGGAAQRKPQGDSSSSKSGQGGGVQRPAGAGDARGVDSATPQRTPPGDSSAPQGGQRGGAQKQAGAGNARGGVSAPKGAGARDAQPLKGVKIVISGIVNPDRARLRDAMLKMGADYAADWGPGCTHLICAFPNTPKYQQVAGLGGTIVSRAWVEKCIQSKARAKESKYTL